MAAESTVVVEAGEGTAGGLPKKAMKVMVAVDDSEESFYALNWALDYVIRADGGGMVTVRAETLTLNGDPKEMICEATEQMHVDLLVMSSRGLGAIKSQAPQGSKMSDQPRCRIIGQLPEGINAKE
ncbi:hypothetical protein QQ045_016983 [Rhodiola kirilowii]